MTPDKTRSYLSPLLEARALSTKGSFGIFAREPLYQGDLVAIWTGTIVTEEELERVPPELRPYVVQVEEELYLLSEPPIEPADYVNHSCQPNAGMSGQIAVVAMRDIDAGEEVCIDYAMCDGSPYDEFECGCGTPSCRGLVTGNDWMMAELHERYAGYFSPYIQRRIDRLREAMGVEDEPMELTLHPISYDSELMELADQITAKMWPQFMLNDEVANRHWYNLYRNYPDYQFALRERRTGQVIGIGNSVPLVWEGDLQNLPDEGWDWALEKAMADYEEWITPTLQCALSITVAPEFRGKGMSAQMIQAMKSIGAAHGLETLIAPVRPTLKSRYPLLSMQRYLAMRREDGSLYDPWLRTHVRAGGDILKICPRAMRVRGSIPEWQQWTEMQFPESGSYIVPDALTLVEIDLEGDTGLYVEPNVWVVHQIDVS